MPIYGPEEKCPHGVQLGQECEPCQELIRKHVVPRKDFGPLKINTESLRAESRADRRESSDGS